MTSSQSPSSSGGWTSPSASGAQSPEMKGWTGKEKNIHSLSQYVVLFPLCSVIGAASGVFHF